MNRSVITAPFAVLVMFCAVARAQGTPPATPVERVLRHEAIVAAPLDSVWNVLTTSEGLRTFVAPVAAVDFRVGGRIETNYNPKAKLGDSTAIVNEIVAYLPRDMFVVRVVAPPAGFQYPDLVKRLWTVYQLQAVSPRETRLVVSMAGWGTGADWDSLYRFFERGNAFTMSELKRRFPPSR